MTYTICVDRINSMLVLCIATKKTRADAREGLVLKLGFEPDFASLIIESGLTLTNEEPDDAELVAYETSPQIGYLSDVDNEIYRFAIRPKTD